MNQILRHLMLLAILGLPATVLSQLQPSRIIQSGMVVQREEVIPLWGTGTPGQQVIVNFHGVIDSTGVDTDGNWYIELDPIPAGGPFAVRIASGEDTIRLQDVYAGDVWIASGQSNMAWTLANSLPPDSTINTGNNPAIRHFNVTRTLLNHPANTLPAGSQWEPAFAEYTGDFSAVAYYFSLYLNASLDIPIGIINTSYGGTRIETWMSKSMLGFDESDIILGDGSSRLQPTLAYNAMLHPLRNIRAKGFIWYQGESNAGNREEAVLYSSLFKKMITSWRSLWAMGDLPFLWVQLPNFGTAADENHPGTWDSWPLIRRSQSSALELPRTGEVVALDLGSRDIHPVDKQPVGERLARIARQLVYGATIISSGPRYLSHRLMADGKVEITFENVEGGIVVPGTDDNRLKWFSIVKSNGSLVRADARTDSNKVIVWNNTVPEPYAIRYAWEANPSDVNFYNKAGLPAAPFYLYVADRGFRIKTFTAGDTHIDRGESTILRWEVFGADSITVNGMPLDSLGGLRVQPMEDSVFTLRATQSGHPENTLEQSVKVFVRQPIPTIEISSDCGQILPLDSVVHISSVVSAEGGAPLSKIEFFVNDEPVFEDMSPPWAFEWIAGRTGTAKIHAIVWNSAGISSVSNDIVLEVRELTFQRYEAEHARYYPAGRIVNNESVSNGQYLDLMSNWTLDFDSVIVYDSGPHLLYIRYLLNYGSPQYQFLEVNDSLAETMFFEAPDLSTWMDYRTSVPLDSGSNKITIDGAWYYMSFDYISVGLEKSTIPLDTTRSDTTVSDTTGTGIRKTVLPGALDIRCYPNPFTDQVNFKVELREAGMLLARITDLGGRTVSELYHGEVAAGTKTFSYRSLDPSAGILYLQLIHNGVPYARKLLMTQGP